jgi:hypothetical protein
MTDLIARSSYDVDMWLQRGSGAGSIEEHLGLGHDSLSGMSQAQLNQLVGKKFTNHSFTSSAVNKGSGFSGRVIWNIYAPKGTQMMYAEPFSSFGHGDKLKWDGLSKQKDFGSEAEMIIQRGASFEITKLEKKGSAIYMDVEVHPERGYKLIQQNPDEWKGSKDKFK